MRIHFAYVFFLATLSVAPPDPVRISLQESADSWFSWLLVASTVVALGVVLEAPEATIALIRWFQLRRGKQVAEPNEKSWAIPASYLGLFFVILGVVGEGAFEALVSKADTALRAHDNDILAQAQRNAGDAKNSASKAADASARANGLADAASMAAAKASSLAQKARTEADSFERDIVSAKTQAASAEAHLADALKQAVQAEQELKDIRSPRVLTEREVLIADLVPFKGTEYKVNVFQDEESIQFLRVVNSALEAAGWTRKPAQYHLGITSLNVFGQNHDDSVPVCVDTGIHIRVRSKDSSDTSVLLPRQMLPLAFQAAIAASDTFRGHISPKQERNVGPNVEIQPERIDEPMTICIGKKP